MYKIINTVIIFVVIGVFLWPGAGYALRPPLQFSSTQREFLEQLNPDSPTKSAKWVPSHPAYKEHILRIRDLLSIVDGRRRNRKDIKAKIITALLSIRRDGSFLFNQKQAEKIARLSKLGGRLSILEHLILYQIERSGEKKFLFNGTHITLILYSSRSEAEIEKLIGTLKGLGITEGIDIALILQSSRSEAEIKNLIGALKGRGIKEGTHIALILHSSRSEAEIKKLIGTLKFLGITEGTHIAQILHSSRSEAEIEGLIKLKEKGDMSIRSLFVDIDFAERFKDPADDNARKEALKSIHGYVPTDEILRRIDLVDRLINGTLTDEDKKTLEKLGIKYDMGITEAPIEEIYDAIPGENDKDVLPRVRASIERLTPTQRQVIILSYYMGLNKTKIGKLYDFTRERVSRIRAKALKDLKIILERTGINYNYIKVSPLRISL